MATVMRVTTKTTDSILGGDDMNKLREAKHRLEHTKDE